MSYRETQTRDEAQKGTFIHAVHPVLLLYFNYGTYNDKERNASWNARHKN